MLVDINELLLDLTGHPDMTEEERYIANYLRKIKNDFYPHYEKYFDNYHDYIVFHPKKGKVADIYQLIAHDLNKEY